MEDLNTIFILGNLTRDPELKYSEKGAAYTELSIAANKLWKSKDGQEAKAVDFLTLTCWNSLAENCASSLSKGSRVMAAGHIKFSTQEKEGKSYSRMFLVANAVAASLEFNDIIISNAGR